ncbi:MAG: recombinase family protein [Lachnospiraceae bacterium]
MSGTQAKKRHGFMQMIEDASKGMFDLVCTREVSRFARNTLDSLDYTRRLKNMGVEVFFYNDNIWSCESDGELRLTIMSAMSQEESKHISDRVLAGHKTSREKGVLFGNGNILGYRLVRGKTSVENTYEIIEEEAETVRLIYDLYLSGLGVKAIASKLIELHRKKANGECSGNRVPSIVFLNNKDICRVYIGYLISLIQQVFRPTIGRVLPILDRSPIWICERRIFHRLFQRTHGIVCKP